MVWYATSEDELRAITQLEHDSDRAAAIVAAAIIETRLTAAIRERLYEAKKITDNLFRSSGPLGSFSTKVDLGLLLGILSDQAHRELVTIKNIRNAFAHHLDIVDFKSPRIVALCSNLNMFESYVADSKAMDQFTIDVDGGAKINPPTLKGIPTRDGGYAYIAIMNLDAKMKLPRERYLLSAMVFNQLIAYTPGGRLEAPRF